MNPKFTEVILNSFIFVMDILCANPAKKLILHMMLVSVSYTLTLGMKSDSYLAI